jgi:hypothetical protein
MTSVWEGVFGRQGISASGAFPWPTPIERGARSGEGDDFEEVDHTDGDEREKMTDQASEFTPDPDFDDGELSSELSEEASPEDDGDDPYRGNQGRLVRPEELADEYEDDAGRSFKEKGFEAIAWYAPITFFGPKRWGIYFHEPRFWGYSRRLQRAMGTSTLRDVARDLYRMIDRHESFHAAVELFALVSQDLGAAPGVPRGWTLYEAYFDAPAPVGYRSTFCTCDCIEESLATAAQFRHLRPRVKGLKAAIEHELTMAPPGYRDWVKFRTSARFQDGLFDLTADRILSHTHSGAAHVASLKAGMGPSGKSVAAGWWFPPLNPEKLSEFGRIPHYAARKPGVYTKLFPPSILGNRKMKDVRRMAQRLYGATVSDGHAKHAKQLVFPNGEVVPLPNAKGVPNYIIEQIAKAANKRKREVLEDLGYL